MLTIIFLIIVAVLGLYAYRTNWFHELDARFEITPMEISVKALDGTYHDCKVTVMPGDYYIDIPILRQQEARLLSIQNFRQWNGTQPESIKALEKDVEVKLRCKEGRFSARINNPYSELK